MQGPGVQVDDVGGLIDDLLAEQRRHAAAKRPRLAAREAAVEIATVGQVAAVLNEAEDVDDGHADQGAPQPLDLPRAQQPAHDLHAVDLVAMDAAADQHHRARLATVHHLHRNVEGRMGIESGRRHIDLLTGSGGHAGSGELEGSASHGATS